MMGLLSTIRGNKDAAVMGSTDTSPIQSKTKKLVIQEWPRLLEKHRNIFTMALIQSTNRSNSVKKALGFAVEETAESLARNEYFITLADTVKAFFYKVIVTFQLDDTLVEDACQKLGARHVDFIARGFHSNYWDIFMLCFFEAIELPITSSITDEAKKTEMLVAWQRVINTIVQNMRAGFTGRQKVELQVKTKSSFKK